MHRSHVRSLVAVLSVSLACSVVACGPKSNSAGQPAAKTPAQPAPAVAGPSEGPAFQTREHYLLKSVGDPQISPDGTRIAYSIQQSDRPGRPYSQLWIMEIATGKATRVGSEKDSGSGPRWSRDGRQIAYQGSAGGKSGVIICAADGSAPTLVAPTTWTNHVLPSPGERIAWSPDGKQLAFLSTTPGPETEDATGDPVIITRYSYKPQPGEGMTRFDDNRRVHIFVVDLGTRQVRQLTTGNYYEHSIDWSPNGEELLFITNHEPDPDRVFNYDIFALKMADGSVRQLTRTPSAEYRPRWSPDGETILYLATTRPKTSSETTMEDTHAYTIDKQGRNKREIGSAIDNRQGQAGWSSDGQFVYITVQEGGDTRLYRLPRAGGQPTVVVPAAGVRGAIGAWSLASSDVLAYTLSTPAAPAELFLNRGSSAPKALTAVNRDLLAVKKVADVESFRFKSFDGKDIEAFITLPLAVPAGSTHPLIVMIHGGPHGQQGPGFNHKAQVYAARGWASLMVNYRGSIGYGQKFADAIAKDQNGGEARDILAGVDAAIARYPWIDASRLGIEGGSYGGQLTNWIITQTDRFKAAVPDRSISNLVTQHYMMCCHDYLPVEYGAYPHEMWRADDRTPPRRLVEELWDRSAIRLAYKVKTPTLFVHGENDNDVCIAEIEQLYIALKEVGVDTVMLRYPREGHGLRESAHVVDSINRSIAWYEKYFPKQRRPTTRP